jgi:copper(I)-binding protein
LGISGGNSAIYLKIENPTGEDDALVSASCDAAMMTELHMTQMMDDGTMKMEPQEKIPLPAGQTVELKPGGLHIMLMNLKKDLKTGDMLTLKLKFEKNGTIEVKVPVREP